MNTTMNRAEVEADIKQTLGLVPHFFLRSAGSDWFRDTVGAEPAGQGSGGW